MAGLLYCCCTLMPGKLGPWDTAFLLSMSCRMSGVHKGGLFKYSESISPVARA